MTSSYQGRCVIVLLGYKIVRNQYVASQPLHLCGQMLIFAHLARRMVFPSCNRDKKTPTGKYTSLKHTHTNSSFYLFREGNTCPFPELMLLLATEQVHWNNFAQGQLTSTGSYCRGVYFPLGTFSGQASNTLTSLIGQWNQMYVGKVTMIIIRIVTLFDDVKCSVVYLSAGHFLLTVIQMFLCHLFLSPSIVCWYLNKSKCCQACCRDRQRKKRGETQRETLMHQSQTSCGTQRLSC